MTAGGLHNMQVRRRSAGFARSGVSTRAITIFGLAVLALVARGHGDPVEAPKADGAAAGILIRLDERALRAAGIVVEAVAREHGGADFALPGNVVIPPGQVHVVAAPAAGLV